MWVVNEKREFTFFTQTSSTLIYQIKTEFGCKRKKSPAHTRLILNRANASQECFSLHWCGIYGESRRMVTFLGALLALLLGSFIRLFVSCGAVLFSSIWISQVLWLVIEYSSSFSISYIVGERLTQLASLHFSLSSTCYWSGLG